MTEQFISRPVAFVDWGADVNYISPYDDPFGMVYELLFHTLMHDEVLIQDETLALSPKLAKYFVEDLPKWVLQEIFETGAVKVLTLHPQFQPEDLADLFFRSPIIARTRYIERNVYREFTPNNVQNRFHNALDGILMLDQETNRSVGSYGKMQILPKFARKLTRVLSKEYYREWRRDSFQLDGEIEDAFISWIGDPNAAQDEAKKRGVKVKTPTVQNETIVFSRSLGEELAALFDRTRQNGMQKLMQTTFADVFCQNELADGHFSPALTELLFRPLSGGDRDEPVVRIDTELNLSARLPALKPGFGKVIREVRDTQAGREFRLEVAEIGKHPNLERFKFKWDSVAEEIAIRMETGPEFKLRPFSGNVGEAFLGGLMVGGIFAMAHHDKLGPQHLMHAFGHALWGGGVYMCGDWLREAVAAYRRQNVLRAEIEGAVSLRCTPVSGWAESEDAVDQPERAEQELSGK